MKTGYFAVKGGRSWGTAPDGGTLVELVDEVRAQHPEITRVAKRQPFPEIGRLVEGDLMAGKAEP